MSFWFGFYRVQRHYNLHVLIYAYPSVLTNVNNLMALTLMFKVVLTTKTVRIFLLLQNFSC